MRVLAILQIVACAVAFRARHRTHRQGLQTKDAEALDKIEHVKATSQDHEVERQDSALASQTEEGLGSYSCSSFCQSQNAGNGRIIGTSPSCAGHCSECTGFCKVVTLQDNMSDYGKGCWTGDKVCCCDRAGPPPGWRDDQDMLALLNVNTYLLEVRVVGIPFAPKPNLEERAVGLARWFNTLSDAEVPDVVVLSEIFSWDAETMMRNICSEAWQKNDNGYLAKFIPCSSSSKFGFATAKVNAAGGANPKKGGGVVVLVKKGCEITAANDQVFTNSTGGDSMTYKGFWAVQMLKGTQKYWVLGTHAQAYEGAERVAVRRAQFRQMRAYADANVEDGARLVYSGDMNIMTGPYLDEDGREVFAPETEGMLSELGAPGKPATGGDVMPLGFWFRLDEPIDAPGSGGLPASADNKHNHYIYNLPDERRLGSHQFDWNVVPGVGDRLASPASAKVQVVPMKDVACFASDLVSGRSTDDLSDHNGVYSEFCYASGGCPSPPALSNKRGVSGRVPAGPFC